MKNTNVKFDENEVFLGIDVSKDTLAVFVSLDRKNYTFENNEDGHLKIAKLCKRLNPVRICMEPTGGYETAVYFTLHKKNLRVCRVNAKRVRDFAKGHGLLFKTDQIDAEILAVYGMQVMPEIFDLPTEEHRRMTSLSKRREQLLKMLTAEKNRLYLAEKDIHKRITGHIKYIESELLEIEKEIETTFKNSSLSDNAALIESIPGVSTGSSYSFLTEIPELGNASNRTIAALAGVAPFTQKSGKWRGKEKIQGGRKHVRAKLYMAAFNAVQYNPVYKELFERHQARGKPYKVAMVAVMRKLICVCNSLIKTQNTWDSNFA